MLKKIPFFQNLGTELKDSAYRELSKIVQFQQCLAMDNIIEFGESGDKFYIILLGVVSINIPNPKIQSWGIKRRRYQQLLQWKQEVFD
jgi:hypothetical protein